MTKQMDRELLRKATLRFLSERFRLALDSAAIHRLMTDKHYVDGPFDEDDLAQALVILIGEGYVDEVRETLGATICYQATGKGIIANERINQ